MASWRATWANPGNVFHAKNKTVEFALEQLLCHRTVPWGNKYARTRRFPHVEGRKIKMIG